MADPLFNPNLYQWDQTDFEIMWAALACIAQGLAVYFTWKALKTSNRGLEIANKAAQDALKVAEQNRQDEQEASRPDLVVLSVYKELDRVNKEDEEYIRERRQWVEWVESRHDGRFPEGLSEEEEARMPLAFKAVNTGKLVLKFTNLGLGPARKVECSYRTRSGDILRVATVFPMARVDVDVDFTICLERNDKLADDFAFQGELEMSCWGKLRTTYSRTYELECTRGDRKVTVRQVRESVTPAPSFVQG